MKSVVYEEIRAVLGTDFVLEKPRDKSLAHYATPFAFGLAKSLKKAPALIANELAAKFKSPNFDVSAVNGYLNFRLKTTFLERCASEALNAGENFGTTKTSQNSNLSKDKGSLFLEYISANPTGPLHIGHVRGAVFGDSLARIAKHLGVRVKTEYYINDAGNQIDLLGTSISLWARENLLSQTVEYPEKYYRGEYIEFIAKAALDKFGEAVFLDETRNGELAEFGKDIVLDIIKKDLKDAGITIESWASERSFYPALAPTLARFEESGECYKKDGATYIASSKLGDDSDRIIVREDGRPTYLAGDAVYHGDKFAQGFDRYINIWGADHHGYIPRIKAAVHFLGYDEERLEVILMQMVSLLKDGKPYKMSKRAGNAILMSDILGEIGSDALRFVFVSKSNNTSLEFDVESLKKQDSSNPVFYINYAHARVHQLFKKAGLNLSSVNFGAFEFDGEMSGEMSTEAGNLLFEALLLPEVLEDAFEKREIHKLADYLKNLSGMFHKFYNENRVLGSQNERALLKLFAVVANTIRVGLGLLGIEAKSEMNASTGE